MSVWEEIVDYTVPSNTTSVDFTGLNITKDDFIKVVMTAPKGSLGFQRIHLFANNDTTESNYWNQRLLSAGSSVSASRNNLNYFLAFDNNSGSVSQTFGYFKLSENGKLNTFANNNRNLGSLADLVFWYTTSLNTFNSITSLNFVASNSDQLAANSRIQIYRLTAEKVADITVSSNTTQVDITGLNIDKGSEYLLVSDVSNSTSSFPGVNLFVNNNTTQSNYYNQTILGNGTSSAAVRGNHANFTDQTTLGPNVVYSHIKLSNIGAYTSQNYVIRGSGSSSLQLRNRFISSTFENITNITQLNIITGTTNAIATGSRFTLYKLY